MRQYLCECQVCHTQRNVLLEKPTSSFPHLCPTCSATTPHVVVLTRKAKAAIRAAQEETALRQSILDQCARLGFTARFLYESVIITTPISSWQFGYHDRFKTLRHESTYKVNLKTGDPAKTHEQFRNRKMTNEEVIEYIAEHDRRRQIKQSEGKE